MTLIVFTILLCGSHVVYPQLPATRPPASQQPAGQPGPIPTTDQLRGAALAWLDEYLSSTALFKPRDVAGIRDKVKKMTPAELDEWVRKTEKVRAVLGSDSWQRTNTWLHDFLKVQAIYSDQEIDELRTKAAKMTPHELIGLLDQIEKKHRQMTWMHSVSERNRVASLKAGQETARQQAASRRSYSGSSRPLFGSTGGRVDANKRYSGKTGASREPVYYGLWWGGWGRGW